ncbi:MAG TPA: MarC family protein, partial [Caulobacteraceae bacterium]
MSLADLSVNFFVALFALIDPIGNVPVFAAATVGATP